MFQGQTAGTMPAQGFDIHQMVSGFFTPRGIDFAPRRESPVQVVARLNSTLAAQMSAGNDVLAWADATLTEIGYDADECVSYFETGGVRVALPSYPCRFHLESDWLGHMAERRAA